MGTRDTYRESNHQAIVDAGLDRLLSNPMEMLRSLLNASSLSAAAGVSKDTTYRIFADPSSSSSDVIVREVATAATRPGWSGFSESSGAIARAFQASIEQEKPFKEAIIDAMAADAEAQFRSPGCPVGWILHAAAITASPAWKGDQKPPDEDRALGEELLAVRARFYSRMSDDLLQLMVAFMSMINRRPRRGMDPRQLLALLHSMVDGAVLRRYIEPDAFDNHLIGEAVYALAIAFSVEGTLHDPRRPTGEPAETCFDAMIEQAATSWETPSSRTIATTAYEAQVDPGLAEQLFPSLADLADAVVWAGALGGGSLIDNDRAIRAEGRGPQTELALVFGLLRRLRDMVDLLPGAMTLLTTTKPVVGIGVRAQLEQEISEVLASHCPGVAAPSTAIELVRAAFTGRSGWETVTSLVRVLEHSATSVRPSG